MSGPGPGTGTLRECCVDTDEGLSWRSGDESCIVCIGKREGLITLHI